VERLSLLTLPAVADGARALVERCGPRIAKHAEVFTDADAFLSQRYDLVVECAGHAAVKAYGTKVLGTGTDLLVVSIGSLTDDTLRNALRDAAEASGARLILCSGAIGGIDLLSAARLSGIESITYTSRKAPKAWKGTPAEKLIDLDNVTAETVFYEGTARAAARDYPQNANSAATIAIASVGLDNANVRLIADPAAPGNVHEFQLTSACMNASATGRVACGPAALTTTTPRTDRPRTPVTSGLMATALFPLWRALPSPTVLRSVRMVSPCTPTCRRGARSKHSTLIPPRDGCPTAAPS
jgi:aspartate dehydrogenase